ncbi:hypothetical protein CLAIMM_03028 [Cladophialophora immunda]|nr:hypothetical protein CLAIMM_03028 [Cladophialophora immunda]
MAAIDIIRQPEHAKGRIVSSHDEEPQVQITPQTMSTSTAQEEPVLYIYATICKPVPGRARNHTLVQVRASQTPDVSLWIHVTGGPQMNPPRPFQYTPQADKPFAGPSFPTQLHLGTVPATARTRILNAAKAVPVPQAEHNQDCQDWTLAYISSLEKKSLVTAGSSQLFAGHMQPKPQPQAEPATQA